MSRTLSPRETELYGLLLQGLSNKQIGAKMSITTRTAEAFCSRVLCKLGYDGRLELMAAEIERLRSIINSTDAQK